MDGAGARAALGEGTVEDQIVDDDCGVEHAVAGVVDLELQGDDFARDHRRLGAKPMGGATTAEHVVVAGAREGRVAGAEEGACGVEQDVVDIDGRAILVERSVARVHHGGDVRFEGVPFEGTVPLIEGFANLHTSGDGRIEKTVAGRIVSLDYDGETMEVAVGELRFTLIRRGEELEFGGRRARLVDGAKRVVFATDGTVEVTDRE